MGGAGERTTLPNSPPPQTHSNINLNQSFKKQHLIQQQHTNVQVLIGGTMGTCSYVLTGTDAGFEETFGSTCHGAGAPFAWLRSLL